MNRILLLISIFVFYLAGSIVTAQDVVIDQTEQLLIQIRTVRGEILFQRDFSRLKFQFEQLKENSAGRALTNGEISLAENTAAQFTQIRNDAKIVYPLLADLLNTRLLAVNKGAEDFAPGLFGEAETRLAQLAKAIAKNPGQSYSSEINLIAAKYQRAHFQAIKSTLLSEVKILVQESRNQKAEKFAPRTFAQVQTLLQEVEKALKNNQYNDPFLLDKSDRLYDEAKHLYNLSEIANQIKKNDGELETYLLKIEDALKQLAESVGYLPDFSEGILPVIEDLNADIGNWRERSENLTVKNERMADSLKLLQQENRNLSEQIAENNDFEKKSEILLAALAADPVNVAAGHREIRIVVNDINFEPGQIRLVTNDAALVSKIGRLLQNFAIANVAVSTFLPAEGNVAYTENLAGERSKNIAGLLQVSGLIDAAKFTVRGGINATPGTRLLLVIKLLSIY